MGVLGQVKPEYQERLRDHQVEPVRQLVSIFQRYQSAVDLSDMGVGKTYVACAVAAALNRPTLIVVPKVAVTSWERAAEHFGERFSIIGYEKLRTGRTPFGWWEHPLPESAELEYFKCQCCQLPVDIAKDGGLGSNYSPCYTHPKGFHCLETHRESWDYGRFNFHHHTGLVIFDECHRCGGMDSLNAEMMLAVKRQGIKMLGLSATAACNPLNMRALGYNLGLHNDRYDTLSAPNFFRWASRYGCRRDPRFHGFKWLVGKDRQLETMKQIRESIIPSRGVRITTESIPGFPERSVSAELYDLEEDSTIDRLYVEMAESIKELNMRAEFDGDHPLTKILRARQKIELLKVPVAVELARDLLDKGYSVGIFVNFSATMKELRCRLKCDCFIDGSRAGVRNRQRAIDSFNANDDRLILINSEAGGVAVSLPDLTGDHPRVGLVFPGINAVTFRQLLGRFHRENSKSRCHYRVIFAANTVEESVHRNLRAKLDNLDELNNLNDDDLRPENLHLSMCSINEILSD